MPEIGLLQNERVIFKSSKTIELENNSNRPARIAKKLGKYWVYVTNLRLVFYSDSASPICENLENIDYFSFFEKGKVVSKSRIRVWIGLTRLDLISDKENLQEILGHFKASIQLKLKKGGVIISHIEGKETFIYKGMVNAAKAQNIDFTDFLMKGSFSFSMTKEETAKIREKFGNEDNWNFMDCPDGSVRITIVPAFRLGNDTAVPFILAQTFVVEPSLNKTHQDSLKRAIEQSGLKRDFAKIALTFHDGFVGQNAISAKEREKRMLVECNASSPSVGYPREMKDQLMTIIPEKFANWIINTIQSNSETKFEAKLEKNHIEVHLMPKAEFEAETKKRV